MKLVTFDALWYEIQVVRWHTGMGDFLFFWRDCDSMN